MASILERKAITSLGRINIGNNRTSSRCISSSKPDFQDNQKGELEKFKRERSQLTLDVVGDEFDFSTKARGYSGRSNNGIVATVFNGTSFVAKALLARLGKIGSQTVIAYRGDKYDVEKYRVTGGLGQVYFAHYDLRNDESIYNAMRYSNVVVNLIGKENETRNFSFKDVHIEGPRRMARLAREAGVKKFIHFSALNANPEPKPVLLKHGSQFLKTKYYGELAVREEFPEAIIFRPSDIAGERDNFLNHYLAMKRSLYTNRMSIWDYYEGVEKQPVWVNDVVSGVEKAIFDKSANGKTFQAVGPYRYNFYELICYMRDCGGQGKFDECYITNLKLNFLMRAVISCVERTRKYPFITWERVERDSISDFIDPKLPKLEDLGVTLTPLETHIRILADAHTREHRVEIPYESAIRFDLPERLNVTR